jgi:hypothetical protein
MAKDYIEERNGGYYVAGSRVSLDSVIYAFYEETRLKAFPSRSPGWGSSESLAPWHSTWQIKKWWINILGPTQKQLHS